MRVVVCRLTELATTDADDEASEASARKDASFGPICDGSSAKKNESAIQSVSPYHTPCASSRPSLSVSLNAPYYAASSRGSGRLTSGEVPAVFV